MPSNACSIAFHPSALDEVLERDAIPPMFDRHDILWVLGRDNEVVDVYGYVFICAVCFSHPDVGFCLRGSETHVSHHVGEAFVPT